MAKKRRLLKALALVMMASASLVGAVDPREIEDVMEIMNKTQVEFALPVQDGKDDGNRWWLNADSIQPDEPTGQRSVEPPESKAEP
jgi:hypothetical protein